MSGIVGIVNLDGAPVDRHLLQQMTEAMAFRGPDAQEVWSLSSVGLGHAMLRTTHESVRERQPASLDGEVWITADARVDARAELISKLESKGRCGVKAATDAELILHAYHVWGEECVEHLLGDFAFAIWDGRRRRLFCARDHFGVKLLYYAQVGNSVVFGNTLNCVRMHPGVSDELNDLAIADFLLGGLNEEPATTTFADILRLPAAHTLTLSDGALCVHRYWTLPVEGPVHYTRTGDYVEHFRELLRTAVEDRLRTDRVSVFMSGGMDSSTIAATAKEVLSKQSAPFELCAHTVVYDRLIPDQERRYSTMVAQALGMPIHHLVADGYALYERWEEPGVRRPEPFEYALPALEVDQYRQVAGHSRVVLTGDGGDPGLRASLSSHLLRQARGLQLGRLARDLGRYLMAERRLSRLYLRKRLEVLFGKNRWRSLYPRWLNRTFEARWDLRTRWERVNDEPTPNHPVRPEAYGGLTAPYWQWVFEGYDAGVTFSPVEARHPFFDLRVMRYLLTLPRLPWCADKMLFREAMRGILPERVRLRPKTPLVGDPIGELLKRPEAQWVDHFEPEPALGRYVDRNRVPPVVGEKDYYQRWINLRPLSLNLWLQTREPFVYKRAQEERRETAGTPSR